MKNNKKIVISGQVQTRNFKRTEKENMDINEGELGALNNREKAEGKTVKKAVRRPSAKRPANRAQHAVRKNEYAAHKILEEAKSLKQYGRSNMHGEDNNYYRVRITLQQLIDEFKRTPAFENAVHSKQHTKQVQKAAHRQPQKQAIEKA